MRQWLCAVLVSKGYPGHYDKGFPIQLPEPAEGIRIYHSGTAHDEEGRVVTNGGRVLAITARGTTIQVERVPLAPHRAKALHALADALWQVKSKRLLRHLRQEYDLAKYELLVGMSYRTFPLPVVAQLSKLTGLPALMDCRDIVEEYTAEGFLPAPLPRWLPMRRRLYSWLRNRFIKARTAALQQAVLYRPATECHHRTLCHAPR